MYFICYFVSFYSFPSLIGCFYRNEVASRLCLDVNGLFLVMNEDVLVEDDSQLVDGLRIVVHL